MIEKCYKQGVNIISSMGTGNKLDPTQFEVTIFIKLRFARLLEL